MMTKGCGMYSCKFYPSQEKLLQIVKAQTQIIKTGFDITSVMFLVVQQAMELTGSNGAVIELVDGEDMVYSASCGSLEQYLGFRLKVNSSLSGMCIKTNEMLYSKDCFNDERVDQSAVKKLNIKSMVVMPLKHNDTTVGVLKVVSSESSFFKESDLCTMSLMAEMMAATMFYANKFSTNELYLQATRDALTSLYNRGAFYDFFWQYIATAKEKNHTLSVLIIDMDGLKPINDTYGHKAGDVTLIEFANRLKHMNTKMILARLGGDEFGVLIDNIAQKELLQLIDDIHTSMRNPIDFDDVKLKCSASIGYSVFPDMGDNMHNLIEIADMMMYENKKLKKQDNKIQSI